MAKETALTNKHVYLDELAVISNYNTDPCDLIKKFKNVALYDQSDSDFIKHLIKVNYPQSIITKNSGHSLSNYFLYIINNYHNLPETIYFLKSNVSPRHISEESLVKKLNINGVIPIFDDKAFKDKPRNAYHLVPGYFIERNNSWFMSGKEPKYFSSCDGLLQWLFVNPITPEYLLFAPGANYKTYGENLKNYPIVFWQLLNHIVSYKFFPPEAYIVERVLFIIFTGEYELNSENFEANWLEKLESKSKSLVIGATKPHPTKFSWLKKRVLSKIIYELDKRKLI
jgi:hypothetical protein